MALLLPPFATSTEINKTSVLNIGNGGVAISGSSGGGCIEFFNTVPVGCGETLGDFNIIETAHSPFVVGDAGNIQNIRFDAIVPLTGFFIVPAEGVIFDLASITINSGDAIGSCTRETGDTDPGASCTPAGMPFVLTNGLIDPATGIVDTVGILFDMQVIGYTGSMTTGFTTYAGIFTTQSADGNIDSALALLAAGGSLQSSWSATFIPVSATSEPVSFALSGSGLASLAILISCVRRKKK